VPLAPRDHPISLTIPKNGVLVPVGRRKPAQAAVPDALPSVEGAA